MSGLPRAQAKGAPARPLGLYVHVPFCASTCDFCAFYQTRPTAEGVAGFLAGIEREAELVAWDRPVTSVFWGGGTPGLLAPRALASLAAEVRARTGVPPPEWTVEMAPAAVTGGRLAVLRDAGVTRISMGVQSFRPQMLEALGRQHTRRQVFRAYDAIRAAGFPSVNLDLMFALPGQTDEEWSEDIREAVNLAPDHVSTYCLTFEEDTKLWVRLSEGRVRRDPETEARLYESTWRQLAAAGYTQYEVSNFARPRHQCWHNLNTWCMEEWIGLGPSAASQFGGWRASNVADLHRWSTDVENGGRMTEERVALTSELLAEDALIFGLRMNAGVNVVAWRRRAPSAPWEKIAAQWRALEEQGLLECAGEVVRLTDRGRLLADAVGVRIMEVFEPDAICG